MNQSRSFIRKVIYIALIGVLLAPISMISRPSSLGTANIGTEDVATQRVNDTGDAGGELARLRSSFDLAQDKLSQIDPASETMKLASLGLRGVAVNLLWGQADKHGKMEEWDQLEATLNMLVKIQPNFVKVWDFQAHNLSYNISMEFDDYEYRYHWVKKGIKFLTQGIGYNYRDHRMTDSLGFFTGMKIGNSDEKKEFRRMFRVDRDFHEDLSSFVEPELYDTREFGHDNWKMAYQWYDWSRRLVDEQGFRKYTGDLIFYMRRPAQLRNMALGLQHDFRTDETIQATWAQANQEWSAYGSLPITAGPNSSQITLESLSELDIRLERLRTQLDEFSPGVRDRLTSQFIANMNLSDEDKFILDLPADQRTDEQRRFVRDFERQLSANDIDALVAQESNEKDAVVVLQLYEQIKAILADMATVESNLSIANYRFWKVLSEVESTRETVQAHQRLFDATELQRQSIFDDEYQLDRETNQRVITRKGAISVYDQSFAIWSEIMKSYPILQIGKLGDDIVADLKKYNRMLKVTGQKWPKNHPLQAFIDRREAAGEGDELPTSEVVAELYINEDQDDEQDNVDSVTEGGTGETKEEKSNDEKSGEDEAADDKAADDKAADDKAAEGAGR